MGCRPRFPHPQTPGGPSVSVRIACPGCQRSPQLSDNLRGQIVQCPECRKKLRIPEGPGQPPRAAAPAGGRPVKARLEVEDGAGPDAPADGGKPAPPATGPAAFVLLDLPTPPAEVTRGPSHGLLQREIVRPAVALAARD